MRAKTLLDKPLFIAASVAAVLVCIPLGVDPVGAEAWISGFYNSIAATFGVFYQAMAAGTIVFLAWLTLSPYGKIRLGGDAPQYSTFSWAGMLFCAGTGATLLV